MIMSALWSSLTDSSFNFQTCKRCTVCCGCTCWLWTLSSLIRVCVCVCFIDLLYLCLCRWILAMQFLLLSVNLLMILLNVCFRIAGEGGHSEVHRDADVTDGSSGLRELQWDSAGRLPHHHLDDWTQELWRQKGADRQTWRSFQMNLMHSSKAPS